MDRTMGKTQIIAEPGDTRIVMRRTFDAPRELVHRAHVDPELLKEWLGPRRLTMRIEEYDARHGGSYRFVHVDQDGTEYAFRGVFHGEQGIDDGMARTFEWLGLPGHVSFETASFTEQDGRTTVESTSVFTSVDDRDGMLASGMETGLEEGYEKLDELLTRQLAGAGAA
jgi:uncharacterized protein YndB with AHSA1/START domain